MRLVERSVYSGQVLEQEQFFAPDGTRNLRAAEPKPDPACVRTPEEKAAYNYKKSEKRFVRAVNHNFSPRSFYATLTFCDGMLPRSYKEAKGHLDNYMRRLQTACPSLVAMAVIGMGERSGRWHIHAVIGGVSKEIIGAKWTAGEVKRVEALREHNLYDGIDHGRDYTGLALYLFRHCLRQPGHTGKRWYQTKTVRQPEKGRTSTPKRAFTVFRPPAAPKGYQYVGCHESGHILGGYICFKYVMTPEDAPDIPYYKGPAKGPP